MSVTKKKVTEDDVLACFIDLPQTQSICMAITELATLQLKPGNDWQDILPHIRTLEIEQAAWSGYPLHFFDVPDKPGEIVLLSGWESVDAHSQWIASEMNQNLLRHLLPLLDVTSLVHLDIQPSAAWKDARAMVYERAGEGDQMSTTNAIDKIIWQGVGTDAEGKVKGSFRLIAFTSVDAIGDLGRDDEKVSLLVRHDITPM